MNQTTLVWRFIFRTNRDILFWTAFRLMFILLFHLVFFPSCFTSFFVAVAESFNIFKTYFMYIFFVCCIFIKTYYDDNATSSSNGILKVIWTRISLVQAHTNQPVLRAAQHQQQQQKKTSWNFWSWIESGKKYIIKLLMMNIYLEEQENKKQQNEEYFRSSKSQIMWG